LSIDISLVPLFSVPLVLLFNSMPENNTCPLGLVHSIPSLVITVLCTFRKRSVARFQVVVVDTSWGGITAM